MCSRPHPLSSLLLLLLLASTAHAAVFQYALDYTFQRKDKEEKATVWLWIPPEAEGVRGVLMAGLTSVERPMVQHPAVREAAARAGLAVLFTDGSLGRMDVQAMLDRFAETTGYEELRHAPLIFFGHSAGGPAALEQAKRHPDRTLGLIQYRGGVPWMGEGELPDDVPSLIMTGQYDEFGGLMRDAEGNAGWKGLRDDIADKKMSGGVPLGTLLIEPGAGHYSFSDKNARYIAQWIEAATENQVPKSWPAEGGDAPPTLNRPDVNDGFWTVLKWEREPQFLKVHPAQAPLPAHQIDDSDRHFTNWHFTRELGEATYAYEQGIDKRDQFVGWEDSVFMDAGARPFINNPKWVAADIFEVHPKYLEKYPSQFDGKGPRWGQAGEAVGHADVPIHVRVGDGPLEMVSDAPGEGGGYRIRVTFDALNPANSIRKARFIAFSPADDDYRYTEFAGLINRNMRDLTQGKEQTITFPELADVRADTGPIVLDATSDSGLPVRYYVAHGPAEVHHGRLVLSEIPKNAKFPIEVKVVAYQWGSAVEPKVKSATPVERVFHIDR